MMMCYLGYYFDLMWRRIFYNFLFHILEYFLLELFYIYDIYSITVTCNRRRYIIKLEKAFFKVVGMYCITCKPIVEKQIKDETAVKRISINYMTDSVIVEYDRHQ